MYLLFKMGNGPVINSDLVKGKMKAQRLSIDVLASRLGKSVTFTRSVVNGYIPQRDGDLLVRALADILDLRLRDLIIGGEKDQKTA